ATGDTSGNTLATPGFTTFLQAIKKSSVYKGPAGVSGSVKSRKTRSKRSSVVLTNSAPSPTLIVAFGCSNAPLFIDCKYSLDTSITAPSKSTKDRKSVV